MESEQTTIRSVPTIAGSMPPPRMPSVGMVERNSQVSARRAFLDEDDENGDDRHEDDQGNDEEHDEGDFLGGPRFHRHRLAFRRKVSAMKLTMKVMTKSTRPMAKSAS